MISVFRKNCSVFTLLALVVSVFVARADAQSVDDFIRDSGFTGGLIVHMNAPEFGRRVAASETGSFLVHGLYTEPAGLERARADIAAKGLGGRITVSLFDGAILPFVGNSVNLLIAEAPGSVSAEEVMRVLAPRGRALYGNRSLTKPVPPTIDDWTHNLYDASNNAVSRDLEVGPPDHLQWVGNPLFCRSHDANNSFQAMVSAAGRIFYIMDEGSKAFLSLPSKWFLTARDGFNGKVLWRKKLPQPLVVHLDHLKSGMGNLSHRIVAEKDRVYVTMGFNAPVSALDTGTGRGIWVNQVSANAEELILYKGTLYCVVNLSEGNQSKHPFMTMVHWNRLPADSIPRKILALDAATGKRLWEYQPEKTILPFSMTVAENSLFMHDGTAIVSLDRMSGRELWSSEPIDYWKEMGLHSGVTMVFHDGVLLFSCTQSHQKVRTRKKENTMTGLDAKTGEVLWTREHRQFANYFTAVDLMVADGLVWSAGLFNTEAGGKYVGIDPKTGKDVRDFEPDPAKHMAHHRCHRNRGTERYLFTGRTGIDVFDVKSGIWSHDFWARGSCRYGMMPANGILYVPPNSCACFPGALVRGFNAMVPAKDSRRPRRTVSEQGRLVKGNGQPAPGGVRPGDWPTFRGAPSRHGTASSPMVSSYAVAWTTPLGGKLSQPVIANGKAIVSAIDQHTVYALDEKTGTVLWRFPAGGKVDSPPTVWSGRVIFGANDGWVYTISLATGELIWKYRAAPMDRRLVAFENIESPWPVNGSVLVLPDTNGVGAKVYCIAGRSMFLDGGLRMVLLEAVSGRKLAETVMSNLNPETGKPLLEDVWPQSPSTNRDVLSFARGKIWMGQQSFNLGGQREKIYYPSRERYVDRRKKGPVGKKQDTTGDHLFATTGFLDGNQWHRGVWYFGRDSTGGCWGVNVPAYSSPSGFILSVDEKKVYGYGREFFVEGQRQTAHLFGCDRNPEVANVNRLKNKRIEIRGPDASGNRASTPLWDWSERIDVYARAMLVAKNAEKGKPNLLIAAGAPDVVQEYDAFDLIGKAQKDWSRLDRIYEKEKAVAGELGAKLLVVSTQDGAVLSETKLDYPPVFDGMAAAGGSLFLANMNGYLVCLWPEVASE